VGPQPLHQLAQAAQPRQVFEARVGPLRAPRDDLRRRRRSPDAARWRGALDGRLRRLIADRRYRQARAQLAQSLESA